jgi:hypothetical protein
MVQNRHADWKSPRSDESTVSRTGFKEGRRDFGGQILNNSFANPSCDPNALVLGLAWLQENFRMAIAMDQSDGAHNLFCFGKRTEWGGPNNFRSARGRNEKAAVLQKSTAVM